MRPGTIELLGEGRGAVGDQVGAKSLRGSVLPTLLVDQWAGARPRRRTQELHIKGDTIASLSLRFCGGRR